MAWAGGLLLSPVRVFIKPDRKTAELRLTNITDNAVHIQIDLSSWDQDDEGRPVYAPQEGIVFFPRILKISPGKEAIIRFGYRGSAPQKEGAYRVFIRELPVSRPGERTVRMLINISAPVFVLPEREVQEMEVEPPHIEQGRITLRISNTGNRHITVKRVTLRGYDSQGRKVMTAETSGWYILSGRKGRFVIDVPGEGCPEAERCDLLIETEEMKQEVIPLETQSGICPGRE